MVEKAGVGARFLCAGVDTVDTRLHTQQVLKEAQEHLSGFAQFAVFVPAAGSCCRLVTRISTSVDAAVWSVTPQPDDNISSVEEEQRSLFYFLFHCQVLVDCL